MRLFIFALLTLAPHVMAASLVTDGGGKVIGVNELTIERVNYDVTFTSGSFTSVVGTADFSFEDDGDGADAAIESIRDYLNAENVVAVTASDDTNIQVPFDEAGGCSSDASWLRSAQIGYRDDTSEWYQYGDFCDAGVEDRGYSYARFTRSQRQPIQPSQPVPAIPAFGLLLLALGVITLGSRRSRWTKS